MKSWMTRLAGMALTLTALTVYGVADAASMPDIETIMKKVNSGKGLFKALDKDLKAPNVDWDACAKKSQEILDLVSALGKNEPPKGDKKSWEKMTKDYTANAKALKEACDKKDKSAAMNAARKMGGSCKACHDAHKG